LHELEVAKVVLDVQDAWRFVGGGDTDVVADRSPVRRS